MSPDMLRASLIIPILTTLLFGASCTDEQPNVDCSDGQCDTFDGVCTILDRSLLDRPKATDEKCEGAELDVDGVCRSPNGRFAFRECCGIDVVNRDKRNDPLANLILNEGESCAKDYRDVVTRLTAGDNAPCTELKTRVVETSAHHLKDAATDGDFDTTARGQFMLFGGQVPETGGYHTVTTVECGNEGAKSRVMFLQSQQFDGAPRTRSSAGESTIAEVDEHSKWEKDGLRKSLEAIAWDPTGGPKVAGKATGVYNYYALEPADEKSQECKNFGKCAEPEWSFHGNSAQFIELDDDLGVKGNFFAEERRCAECHTGGGLIMRELNTPWINWEESFNTPGARNLLSTHADVMGIDFPGRAGGNQEFVVVGDGNKLWDVERIKIANNPSKAMSSPNALLKPLFCTVEVNVQSTKSFGAFIKNDFFYDPGLADLANQSFEIDIEKSVYDEVAKANQTIPRLTNGTGDAPTDAPFMNVPGFGVVDTAGGGFMVPERAGADHKYVTRLKDANIIDDDLIKAVLGVDFTRPIFSPTRCDLLKSIDLTWDDLGGTITNPTKVRDVIAMKLQRKKESNVNINGSLTPGEVELLANIRDVSQVATKMKTFGEACKARGAADQTSFMKDILHVANVYREKAYDLLLFQVIPSSMPTGVDFKMGLGPFFPSRNQTPDAKLNATDCTLQLIQ